MGFSGGRATVPFKIRAGAETGGGVEFLLNIKDVSYQYAQIYKMTQRAMQQKSHTEMTEAVSASEDFLALFAGWG